MSAPPADSASQDWAATLAAAKQEGSVIVSGPAHELWHQALETFQQDYPDIRLDLTDFDSREFWEKAGLEREGGQYNWDLRIGGPDPQVFDAKDKGWLAPVRPELVLPEVVDDSKWIGGSDALYADDADQYLPAFVAQAQYAVYVNRTAIPESELNDETQLTDPKWKGKIAIEDPRGGAGLGTLTVMLVAFGEPYVRSLLGDQQLVVTGDDRQLAEWLVRGTYPIAIGVATEDITLFQQQGVPVNVTGLGIPRKLSLGSGGIQYIANAPHPNAAKVFMNWVLTQHAEQAIAQITDSDVRRTDVPMVNPDGQLDPALADQYIPHQTEKYLPQRRQAQALGQELLK